MKKYLRKSLERMKQMFIPVHPHYTRSVLQNREIVCLNSFDDTELDYHGVSRPAPSVTDVVMSGDSPDKLGQLPHITGAEEQRIARNFVNAFVAAGKREKSVPAPAFAAPAPAPAPATAPVAPAAPAAAPAPAAPAAPAAD